VSNVQECIDLYLTDEEVSDAQFRAVIVDACARDLIDGPDDVPTSYRADLAATLHQYAGRPNWVEPRRLAGGP